MTNGEKIKEIFPNIDNRLDAKTGIMIVKWADNTTKFFKTSWWNSEYKEPTTKNDLGVDCISREQALVAIRNLYPGMPRVDFNGSLRKWVDKYKPYIECDDAIKQLPSVTPQEPVKKLEEQIKQLQNRCHALTHGQICVFCPYECEHKAESENP